MPIFNSPSFHIFPSLAQKVCQKVSPLKRKLPAPPMTCTSRLYIEHHAKPVLRMENILTWLENTYETDEQNNEPTPNTQRYEAAISISRDAYMNVKRRVKNLPIHRDSHNPGPKLPCFSRYIAP